MKTTLHDLVIKGNKKLSFEERAKKFEEEIKPICEQLGVTPWAAIQPEPDAIRAIPCLRDLWASSKE